MTRNRKGGARMRNGVRMIGDRDPRRAGGGARATSRERTPRAAVVLAAAAVVLATGCAAGTAGGGGDAGATAPVELPQRRNLVRVSGYHPVELINEGSMGVATIPMDVATVWTAVGGVYSELQIPVTDSDPEAMYMGNRGYPARRINRQRMNTFLDCGNDLAGPLANQYDVTLTVYTRVTAKEEGGSEIATVVDAYARARATSGNPIHCSSRGRLESLISEQVAEALGLGG